MPPPDLAADHGTRFPDGIEFLVDLTPYAVEFRYDAAPDDGYDELNKHEVLDRIQTLRSWVVGSEASPETPSPGGRGAAEGCGLGPH